ncbi:MAG TPA: D-amino-acid transaminase [Gemmatimonadaceae bacterium]|nr:D-amino-acid transaminase [Gemmatimonadaceae bacterium]
MLVYLNGSYVDRAAAAISIEDRGFLFGDGIYEVVRSIDAHFIERERHLRRLERSAREIRLDLSAAEADSLGDVALALLEKNGLSEGHAAVYMQVTRGVATRKHAFPPSGTRPTVFVTSSRFTPLDKNHEHGIGVITHPDLRWGRCDIKSVNLLPNVLANQAAHERGCYEAILIRDGVVTEATHSSLFGVVHGTLRTHPLASSILPSVTREIVLELARDGGLKLRESAITERELADVDELFIASTTADVTPVISVDGKPVGDGTPGATTKLLQQAYRWHLKAAARA